jgi:predicted N-acyltransferase
MPDGGENDGDGGDGGDFICRTHAAIGEISSHHWDACAGTDNPFVSYAFLKALEDSGSVRAETGWMPHHLVLENGAGDITACAPLYVKSHSHGEYVFDFSWADAYQRAGGNYYPKLLCAVPFTPATGPRLLVRPIPDFTPNSSGVTAPDSAAALARAMIAVAEQTGVSSLHVAFPSESQSRLLESEGFLTRMGFQYMWHNRGYGDFEDFLGDLASRKRKAVRKERREAQADGLEVEVLAGADITESHWDAFYKFYLNTIEDKSAYAYLTRDFFSLMGAAMCERVVLVMARQGSDYVAGALNLQGSDTLYGRYWGCDESWGCENMHKFLHFELCYYRAIDFAIDHGLMRVEAGAQGHHKISRGYLPHSTWSAHWFNSHGFAGAVGEFVAAERAVVEEDMRTLMGRSPFSSASASAAAPIRATDPSPQRGQNRANDGDDGD